MTDMLFGNVFEEVLATFNKCKVNFIVVGGYAVNFHGYERTTSDLDIWVKSDAANKENIKKAMQSLQYDTESIAHIEGIDFSKPFLFRIGEDPNDIEVFNFISGVTYEEAEPNKILFDNSNSLPVYFISLKDLIVNKMISGRPKDNVDVYELQRIHQLKKDKDV